MLPKGAAHLPGPTPRDSDIAGVAELEALEKDPRK